MPRKHKPERILDEDKLSEAGMSIYHHHGEDKLQTILESVNHHGAKELTGRFFNFKHVLPQELEADFPDEAKEIPESKQYLFVPVPRPHPKNTPNQFENYKIQYPDCQRVEEEVYRLAGGIAKAAQSIREYDEQRWSLFMHRFVFEKFHNMIHEAEKTMTRHALEEKELMRDFRIGSDHCWGNGGALLEENRKLRGNYKKQSLTAPKPDLYFAYHLHKLSDCSPFNNTNRFSDSVIPNFSFENLQKLTQTSKLYDAEDKRFHPCHLRDYAKDLPNDEKCRVAYPWLIGEWKHAGVDNGERSKVVWQAANGCAVALVLLAKLSSRCLRRYAPHDIRPVFAITSVGSEASLWVAFVQRVDTNGALSFEMHRIWYGDLRQHLCAIELCLFLERLHAWAIGDLRRWIIECIRYWTDWTDKLRIQSSANADRLEPSTESSGISLHGIMIEIEQAEETTEREMDQSHVKEPRPAGGSRQATDYKSARDSEFIEDFESEGDLSDATSSNNESSSEYKPSQEGDTDSDYGELRQETDSEEAKSSEYDMDSSQMETPQPLTRHASKQKSPDATPIVIRTDQPHGYFSERPSSLEKRARSVLDTQTPLGHFQKNHDPRTPISDSSTPSRRRASARDAAISTWESDVRGSESSGPFHQTTNSHPQDKPQEKFRLGRESTCHDRDAFSTRPRYPASTPQKPKQQVHSLESPDRTPCPTKVRTSDRTGSNLRANTTPSTRRSPNAPSRSLPGAWYDEEEADKRELENSPPAFGFRASSRQKMSDARLVNNNERAARKDRVSIGKTECDYEQSETESETESEIQKEHWCIVM